MSVLIGLGGMISSQAQAQEYNVVEHFKFYVTSPSYLVHIGKLTVDAEMALATGCREAIAAERLDLQIQIPPDFDQAAAHPKSGQWLDQISVDRCGQQTQQNFLVAAQSGNLPNFLVLLPGTTRTTPLVQGEALPIAVETLASVCPEAQGIQVHNTEFMSEDSPVGLDDQGRILEGQWTEQWLFYACDQAINISMTFTALGDGQIQTQAGL